MSNGVRNILIGGAVLGVGAYMAKKAISAKNLQSQISFYVSGVKANANASLLKNGRIEIATTLRIINGSDISIPFSIPQAQILYKGVQVGISKPDAEITLAKQQSIDKVLTFEVPLTNLGLQSDVFIDLASALLTKGGISAKLDAIITKIKQNITYNVSASANGVVVVVKGSLDTPTTKGIGLSANERTITDGRAYNHLFKNATRTNVTLDRNGDVPDVVANMVYVVEQHYNDVVQLAKLIEVKGDVLKTSEKLWNFAVKYIHYKNDRFGIEELRTPSRSWYDGQINHYQNGVEDSGIDCDDFAIFCGAVLRCLNIPFNFRITKYNGRSYFQHVYLYIPNTNINVNNGKDIIIDPVVDAFNYEKPYSDQADNFSMGTLNNNAKSSMSGLNGMPVEMPNGVEGMPIEMLSGIDNDSTIKLYNDIILGIDLEELDNIDSIASPQSVEDVLYRHLVSTRKVIASNPDLVRGYSKSPAILIAMLDKAISAFYTPERDNVLDSLDAYERSLINLGIIDIGDNISEYQISGGFFKKIKKAATNIHKKAVEAHKKVGKAVAKAGKAVVKAIVKFNPLSIAVRNGMLAAFKLNAFHLSTKVKYGYLTEQEAVKLDLNLDEWRKSKNLLDKTTKIFKKLEGNEDNLRKAILHGKDIKPAVDEEKVSGLGVEPVTTASVGVAMAVITPLIAEAKKFGGNMLKKKATDQISKSTSNLVNSVTKKATEAPLNLVNSLVNNGASVNNGLDKVVDGAVKDIDNGLYTATHYYNNILTESNRESLSPYAYQLIQSRISKEAFGIKPSAKSSAKSSTKSAETEESTTQSFVAPQAASNDNTDNKSSNSNQESIMPIVNSEQPQGEGFFAKNKKLIIGLGIGVVVLGGAYIAYSALSGDKKEEPRRVSTPTPSREATPQNKAPQALGALPKTRKRKKAKKYPTPKKRLGKAKLS